jgi:hypothetical protein
MEGWRVYMEEFRERAHGAEKQRFGRKEQLAEAAHDAYRAAADRLTREHAWADAHTLVVMRGLNAGVQQWIESGAADWDELSRELQRREEELKNGFAGGQPG